MEDTLKRTPLYHEHIALGGKMVPFAGYEMPVHYKDGIIVEHEAVRMAAGLFDASHMGEFKAWGPQALDFIQKVSVNDASNLEVGQCQYTALCLENGGIIDDFLIYRMRDQYMLVVNASRRYEDWDWLNRNADGLELKLEDQSEDIALIALQGPRSHEIIVSLTDVRIDELRYYRFIEGYVGGHSVIISRTGYTGEDGFEIYVASSDAVAMWNKLLEVGENIGIRPAGLGARDSLRLEMGFALYGNDLDTDHTPLESCLGWLVKLDKKDFLGRDVLVRQTKDGVSCQLVGIKLTERGFPRPGYPIVHNNEEVGKLTSGTLSPTLGYGIAMGYVPSNLSIPGTNLGIRVRNKVISGVVQSLPFYKGGSVRR
tara:strand:- start:801 stop:1910 length:1110 start_codon:yes stop_codon:yes gene_type:complete